jgi:hypothetical protein
MSIAQELGLTTEYTTIRAKDNQLVKVDQRISAEHQRILEAAYKAGAQDEREACAQVAENCFEGEGKHKIVIMAVEAAKAIRARGNT